MKIIFLSALYPPHTKGGGEVSTGLIAEGLKKRGHEVEVLTAESTGLSLTAKPLFERAWARRTVKQLAKQVNLGKYDVVHAHDFRTAQVLSELVQMNVVPKEKSYVTVRDYAQICGSPNNLLADGSTCPGCEALLTVLKNQAVVEASLLRKPFRVWQYWHNIRYRLSSFRAIPNHIYISQAQRAQVAKRQDFMNAGIRANVIYNPVSDEYLIAEPKQGQTGYILFAGTIQSYKGVDVLLRAVAKLTINPSLPSIQLKIIGEGAQRAEFENKAQKLGIANKVTFVGWVSWEKMIAEYDIAQIVVAPHLWVEPFGRTTVEAMARGKVVVASNIGGPAEIIHDRKTGLLAEPASVEDLATKLLQALELSDQQRMLIHTMARNWVSEHVSVNQITGKYEKLYEKSRSS